jgi:antitoxin ParD1/3/4
MAYYGGMAMSSLNISLPEALKQYIEGQVSSGDWSTPSEYVRELIRQDKERRLQILERDLLVGVRSAGAKSATIEIPAAEIRKKGLVAALRERAQRK